MKLESKRIVLTGGTRGIGRELVRRLCNENELIVIARKSTQLASLKKEFPNVATHEADLGDGKQVRNCAEEITGRYDRIDVLINNAAVQYTPLFLDQDFDYDSIASEISINLTTPCQLVALLLPSLLNAPEGMIVNINSGLGLVPKTSSAVYCASKGGLNIFSKSLANQLEGTNTSVKQVFLPLVDTAMTEGRGAGKLTANEAAERILAGIVGRESQIDIGKVKLLRLMERFAPSLARNIMKSA